MKTKTKSRPEDFNHTAAGIYAQAMELALLECRKDRQPMKLDGVKRSILEGGCLLCRVPSIYWRKGAKAKP